MIAATMKFTFVVGLVLVRGWCQMDAGTLDRVSRLFGSARSRRAVIGTLLVAGLLGVLVDSTADEDAQGRRRRRRRERARAGGTGDSAPRRIHAAATAASCYPAAACTPGPRRDLAKCDLGGTTVLARANCSRCNLSKTNLAAADGRGVILRGANLGGACLTDADFTGADLSGASLAGAIRCRTVLPDGSVDDSGCGKATSCCPTCIAIGAACEPGAGGGCCGGAECRDRVCACPEDAPHRCDGLCRACCTDAQCDAGRVCCNGRCRAGDCCRDSQCGPGETCERNLCTAPPPPPPPPATVTATATATISPPVTPPITPAMTPSVVPTPAGGVTPEPTSPTDPPDRR
jgi:hypothetical protein